ncbi:DUF397 domain-containing protein [Thermomonospora curvata]|uniref:DUF397 domain-containing protein n=1 Tax=Thermomonospora curvata (strain ATCC 19995 / DSM 43183 / JCM 3096 / KCTC 9072 / NBRC 15933 / NCIMB 10081 / Henssen B9) TaxID=471852 RepID=D1A2F3_THECD|nr:DUF397 domain-containing protein [Thermomonospora curvata]ACY95973.1 protein of unknown function DUF397 [Thermomonospora curvata DSM 43183]
MAHYSVHDATWRRSSHSGSSGGECVEVAHLDSTTAIRDSKNPGAGFLAMKREAWGRLLAEIKQGTYDF